MLEQALQTWRHWRLPLTRQPQVVEQLHGGKTNQSFLCDAGRQQVVVRLNSPVSERLGINRQHERLILETLTDVAPELYFCNSEILVTAYLEGRRWRRDDFQDPANRSRLVALLATIHRQSIDLPAFDYYRHAEHYWRMLSGSGHPIPRELLLRREKLLPLLQELQQQGFSRVLCHHDLVPANIIDTGKTLRLLDWEYAGVGVADFDFATMAAEGVVGLEINPVIQQVYQYVCDLWDRLANPSAR